MKFQKGALFSECLAIAAVRLAMGRRFFGHTWALARLRRWSRRVRPLDPVHIQASFLQEFRLAHCWGSQHPDTEPLCHVCGLSRDGSISVVRANIGPSGPFQREGGQVVSSGWVIRTMALARNPSDVKPNLMEAQGVGKAKNSCIANVFHTHTITCKLRNRARASRRRMSSPNFHFRL